MHTSVGVRLSVTAATALLVLIGVAAPARAWRSAKVQSDSSGRLLYPADGNGNRIPDYSHAGYRGGGVPLPTVPVVLTVSPVSGDNTAQIQAAIEQAGGLPVQPDGYRGTVLLSAGVYQVDGTIRLNRAGVVLGGVGDGVNPAGNTILRRTGTSTATVIVAGSGLDNNYRAELPGTRRAITTPRVGVGSRSFTVDDASPFQVGDPVILLHPSTAAWIAAMKNGGVTDANIWTPGSIDIRYHRYVTAIAGNTIAVDAPVFNHLERSLSQSYLFKFDPTTTVLKNVGIEKLLVDIVTAGPQSEDHALDAITFVGAEDCWLRDATMQHFVHAGVQFASSTRCTVERARAIEPHSLITGERRYNFSTYHAQLILFRDSYASDSRHAFVSNGTSTDSGNVALNSTVERSLTYAEAHRRWSTGLLFDSLVAVNPTSNDVFGFYNRGNYGTGHGWGAGHSVIWNSDAAGGRILVQRPPTAENYAIGCSGNVIGNGPFAGDPGYREGANQPGLEPPSLYLEQVAQRQTHAAPPDLNRPSTPTLSSTGNTASSVALSWTASSDDVAVAGYDVFTNGAFTGFTTDLTFTVTGLGSAGSYTFTVHAVDGAGNLSDASNPIPISTGPPPVVRPPVLFEAEDLSFTAAGASASIATETFASGGLFASNFRYVSLAADGTPPLGESLELVLPDVPAGTFTVVMRYKSHQTNRGTLQLSLDGQPLGGELNQHQAPATFREASFGVVRFASAADHTVRLTVTGRDATALAYTINADVFRLDPDNIAPQITVPPGVTVEATGPEGAVATYAASASDDLDGAVAVTLEPPSGSRFPLGATPVQATAQDFAGNTTVVTFDVTVVDTTPPQLTLPAGLLLEATGPDGAIAPVTARAHDLVAGDIPVRLSHDPSRPFPLGTTTVTADATDDFDNAATGTFPVTVVDTTPPVLSLPSDLAIDTNDPQGAIATFSAQALDRVSGNVAVDLTPPSGTRFPLGTTQVTASTADAASNVSTASFTVTVRPAAWKAGTSYKVDHLVQHQGFRWQCIQAHRSQPDWTPARTPALWVKVPADDRWDHPVRYPLGAEVSYAGARYRCLQAHTSQAGWKPPATPALWQALPK